MENDTDIVPMHYLQYHICVSPFPLSRQFFEQIFNFPNDNYEWLRLCAHGVVFVAFSFVFQSLEDGEQYKTLRKTVST